MYNRVLQASVASFRSRSAWLMTRPKPPSPPSTSSQRYYGTSEENLNVGHSRFIAEASNRDDWEEGVGNDKLGGVEGAEKDFEGITPNKGKISPTSSHLFKLVLPLPGLSSSFLEDHEEYQDTQSSEAPTSPSDDPASDPPPTVFLLHPSQPLSHVSRLIVASLPTSNADVSFQSAAIRAKRKLRDLPTSSISSQSSLSLPEQPQGGSSGDPILTQKPISPEGTVQWSDSTDIGQFIKEAAQDEEFLIVVRPPRRLRRKRQKYDTDDEVPFEPVTIHVQVPSFEDRTHFLRARLDVLNRELVEMEKLKKICDREAHKGARRLALTGFAALVTYWGAVARLTFFDVGWDVMEPVTYLSGLSTVICGYLWFLYQGREVSYSSVLSTSISARRQALYTSHGLDMQRYLDLVEEKRAIAREITKIAVDYDVEWKEGENLGNAKADEVEREGSRQGVLGKQLEDDNEDASDERLGRESRKIRKEKEAKEAAKEADK